MDEPHQSDRIQLDLRLPRTVQAPAMARHALGGVRPRLDRSSFDDLRLLVSELVSNSVNHAGRDQPSWVRLHVDVHDELAEVEVSDPGPGFHAPPERAPPGAASGRGLDIVGAIADRWGFSSHEVTKVWFELRVGPAWGEAGSPEAERDAG